MSFIHHTAKVHQSVVIPHGCYIGPDVIIEKDVVIGAYSIIGGQPEHRDFYDNDWAKRTRSVYIEEGCRLFEFVTIHAGTRRPTIIGAKSAIFNKSHIAHDCLIGRGVTIGGQVSLAGHCTIGFGANISGKSCLAHRVVMGAYAFLGGFSYLTKHMPPGERWVGNPPRFVGHNVVGLERAGLTYEKCIEIYGKEYQSLTEELHV